jgi:hypothetical protein
VTFITRATCRADFATGGAARGQIVTRRRPATGDDEWISAVGSLAFSLLLLVA